MLDMEFEGQKIMVVEDNFMSYKLIEAHLERRNLKLLHAKDGNEALELFNGEEGVRLILMDIQLPKMNGLEVTRMIRETDQDTPIIATTANVFDEDRKACKEAGCTDFISKPINFPELLDLLKEYLH